MADLTQAYDALRKADAAGDVEGARRLAAYIRKQQAAPSQPKLAEPATVPQNEDGNALLQGAGNILAGAVRGASNIGATIINPLDKQARNRRKAIIESQLREWGAQPESMLYKTGEIGAEIAGTAGIGGAMAKAVPFAPKLASALKAGGLAKDAGFIRNVSAGALTGAGAAGLTGGDVKTGAVIGGAIPGVAEVGKFVIPGLLGMTTGAGSEAVKQAYQSGKKGGDTARSFVENMRGNVAPEEVLNIARSNIDEMGAQRAAAYRQGMAQVSKDKSVLSFDGIDNALSDAYKMATFKGQIKNQRAAKSLQEVSDMVGKWKSLPPDEFHTPEGLDALKQSIGGVLESIPFEEKTARNAVGNIYNSIKKEINKQAPTYSNVMKDYSSATETISEIEKALSLGKKASADTSMRKLQSLMRNNVNTNYGNRLELARTMEQEGGREIIPAIAGQALNTWWPRGLQSASTVPTSFIGYTAGGLPLAAGGLLSASPRLVGEASYGVGRLANLASRVPYSQEAIEAARLASIIEGSK